MTGPERDTPVVAEVLIRARYGRAPRFEPIVNSFRLKVTDTADDTLVHFVMRVRGT